MIATPASLRSDFIHIVGMAIHIAPECTNHITGIRSRATRSVGALSQLIPTASSKRLLKGALLGKESTFSVFKPQSGQATRYNSITTVALYSDQGRSRTSRS